MNHRIVDIKDVYPNQVGKVLDAYMNRLRGGILFCNFCSNELSKHNAFVSDYFGIALVFSDKVLIIEDTTSNVWRVCKVLWQFRNPKNTLTLEQLIFLEMFL